MLQKIENPVMQKKEIGILGGSFDPVHRGHVSVAKSALVNCGLDEVWMMVSPENPLKKGKLKTSESERLDMVKIAIESLPEDLRDRISACYF